MCKRFFLLLLVSFLFAGCYKVNKDIVKKPEHLIPRDTMAAIVAHMQIIEGALSYNRGHYPGYQDMEKSYYSALFQHFHVTKKRVKNSLNYYNSKGDEMAAIYQKALDTLDVLQENINLKKQREDEKKFSFRINHKEFPYLYKELFLRHECVNPIP